MLRKSDFPLLVWNQNLWKRSLASETVPLRLQKNLERSQKHHFLNTLLGLRFPATYRRFLLEYGAGRIGAQSINGIVDNLGAPNASNVVWYTQRLRDEVEFPHTYIPMYDVGNGEVFCLDVDICRNDEAPVVSFEPGLAVKDQTNEIVAQDFGEFLLECVEKVRISYASLESRPLKAWSCF